MNGFFFIYIFRQDLKDSLDFVYFLFPDETKKHLFSFSNVD